MLIRNWNYNIRARLDKTAENDRYYSWSSKMDITRHLNVWHFPLLFRWLNVHQLIYIHPRLCQWNAKDSPLTARVRGWEYRILLWKNGNEIACYLPIFHVRNRVRNRALLRDFYLGSNPLITIAISRRKKKVNSGFFGTCRGLDTFSRHWDLAPRTLL